MEFSFSHPQYLYLLFFIPVLFIIHFFSLAYKRRVALKFANFSAISKIQGVDFFSKNVVVLVLATFVIFSMVLAVSGLSVQTVREASSFSFMIAVDSSMSMSAEDFIPNRITVAKETAKFFVDESKIGTKIGIVSFAGTSFIEQDLTTDKILLKNSIDNIEQQLYGGTDINEAIVNSINLLNSESNGAIVLLSDGQINVGDIESTIDYAKSKNIVINTIAMGTLVGGIAGGALTKIDEETLKALAFNTGGVYFNAESEEDISLAFLDILQLTERKVSIEMKGYLIIAAIILFILVFFLVNTKYMNLP
jgi:Ca-activated chloride channel family protein